MTRPWRLIVDDGAEAADGLATDEALMRAYAGDELPPPTLRLYTYRSHCALVGRFQDPAAELNLAACERSGTQVNRRPTGGGAIVMGDRQLGVALVTSMRDPITPSHARAIVDAFAAGIVAGLARLGVTGELRGKNDIAVAGRKIAGLGVYADRNDAVLFHSSVLAGLDVDFMLDVLNIPAAKLSDKAAATVRERITTVSDETGRRVSADELRAAVASGYESAFGVELSPSALTEQERSIVRGLVKEKYGTREWLMQRVADAPAGSSIAKAPGGLIRVSVGLAGEAIKDVLITGDFMAGDRAVAELEAALRWAAAERSKIDAAVEAGLRRGGGLPGISSELLASAVWQAVVDAKARRGSPGSCYYPPTAREEVAAWR